MDDTELWELVPLAGTLGIRCIADDPAEVRLRLEWRPELCTVGGQLHGGTLMALADTAGALCAVRNLPHDATGSTTVESKTNFLRAVSGGAVEAVSRPLHKGRTLIVVETDLRDGRNRLVARVTQSQLVLAG